MNLPDISRFGNALILAFEPKTRNFIMGKQLARSKIDSNFKPLSSVRIFHPFLLAKCIPSILIDPESTGFSKFDFLASSQREVWEISIWASPNINIGCYRLVHLGNFQKCQIKLLKYWQMLWPLSKFHLFPSLGMAIHIIWLQFGKFPLFPPYFWLIGSKSNGIF